MSGAGWLGSHDALMNALRVVNADRDEDGKFIVDGNITSFMGLGEEFCVGGDAVYFVNGERRSLAVLLRSTSQGVKITVI